MLLPRLRRFATVLAGERRCADELLRTTCRKMLRNEDAYQRGTAFDIWAFRQLHADWLEGLRAHVSPIAQARGETAAFASLVSDVAGEPSLKETVDILAGLPAQQRSAALLIYGEGFAYDEAAAILDTTPQTVMARTSRALATFIEKADWLDSARPYSADVQHLDKLNRQAG